MKSGTQIIEISLYWNEDIIFEERIKNTLTYADAFYVAEGNESHSGLIKRQAFLFPKLLDQMKSKYPLLSFSKIHFVPVTFTESSPKDPYERERMVRDAAFLKVKEDSALGSSDILLVTDFDEFTHPAARPLIESSFSGIFSLRKALRLKQRMTYYKLNLLEQSPWDLVLAIKGRAALRKNFSPNFMRHSVRKKAIRTTKSYVGWHHSYLGDENKVLEKIKSISHALDDNIKAISEKDILERLSKGEDLFGRDFQYQKIDYQALQGIPSLLKRKDLLAP